MIVVSHPTVNAFNRALVEVLESESLLAQFHTTLALGRRSIRVSRERLVIHPWREIVRLAASRVGMRAIVKRSRHFGIDAVYRSIDRSVAAVLPGSRARAVYAYEDGAAESFREAKNRGLSAFYELPIAYFETAQRLLAEEAERRPGWAGTLGAPDDPPEKLERKAEEIRLADLVICPSKFVRESLPHGTPSLVAEFGSPEVTTPLAKARGSGQLRVLFAGALTQRKGLADVFEAIRLLKRPDVELILIGAPVEPMEFYRSQFARFRYEPPRPHAAVLELMAQCDVLVLPSIVEGRALVQQEAMSCGLPLIVTPNAGGEDLIDEGSTGWLVPIRSPEAIAQRINWLADHRECLPELAAAARRKASEYSWSAYAVKIVDAIKQRLRDG